MGAGALGWALARRAGAQAAGVAAGAGERGTARACADGRAGRADARGRARQAGHGRAGGARTGAGARGRRAARHGAAGARGRQAGGVRDARRGRAGRAAWARGARGLGVPGRAWCTGWASLRLMQPVWVLIWVFDSVVFLSHRLDSVHEHCSLQKKKFSKKKIIIIFIKFK